MNSDSIEKRKKKIMNFKDTIWGICGKRILQLKERKKYLKSILTFTKYLVKVEGSETHEFTNTLQEIYNLDTVLKNKIKILELSLEEVKINSDDEFAEQIFVALEAIELEVDRISKEVNDVSLGSCIDEYYEEE